MDHLRRHYAIKPYKCDKCGQGFYRNNILKDHVLRCDATQVLTQLDKPSEILKTDASSSIDQKETTQPVSDENDNNNYDSSH